MPLDERDRARLLDMVAHAEDAMTLLGAHTIDDLRADIGIRHGVVRCIEVIGEAAKQVSPKVRDEIPTISWRLMWGMRNRLIHDYGNTNYRIVYQVVRQQLPELIQAITTYLASADGPPKE